MDMNSTDLTLLTIPVPPEPLLEQAIGYNGKARFFATWWQPAGDEAMVSDGVMSAIGQWMGYLAYVEHARVYPELTNYELGASDCPAEYWLIVDRLERKAFVTQPAAAQKFLASQWPQQSLTLDAASMDKVVEALDRWLAEDRQATVADVLAWMEANQKAIAALQTWLNATEITPRMTS